MSEELAGLYVTIGADFGGLLLALDETRAQLEAISAEGGLLGMLPAQPPLQIAGMVLGVQTALVPLAGILKSGLEDPMKGVVVGIGVALAPLPGMLDSGLRRPIDEVLAAIRAHLAQQVAGIINDLHEAARQIADTARMLGVPSPVIPGRAGGGPVIGGRAYLVGEAGPELFIPGSSGQIVPNHLLGAMPGGGSGLSIQGGTFHFYGVQDAEGLYDQLQQVARQRGG